MLITDVSQRLHCATHPIHCNVAEGGDSCETESLVEDSVGGQIVKLAPFSVLRGHSRSVTAVASLWMRCHEPDVAQYVHCRSHIRRTPSFVL